MWKWLKSYWGKCRWIELWTFRLLHKLIKCRMFRLFVMIINEHPISTFQQSSYAVYQAHYQHILGMEKLHLNCRLLQHESFFFFRWWHFQLHFARSFSTSNMTSRALRFEIFPLFRLEKQRDQRESKKINSFENVVVSRHIYIHSAQSKLSKCCRQNKKNKRL